MTIDIDPAAPVNKNVIILSLTKYRSIAGSQTENVPHCPLHFRLIFEVNCLNYRKEVTLVSVKRKTSSQLYKKETVRFLHADKRVIMSFHS